MTAQRCWRPFAADQRSRHGTVLRLSIKRYHLHAKASHHELRNAFRALLASSACYHTASVFDPLSARIAADLGFEAGILGGSVASLQVLAAPDIALITLSEFAEQATRIGRVAQLPVIADADHGNGLNASELALRYSFPDDCIGWAEKYMNVTE